MNIVDEFLTSSTNTDGDEKTVELSKIHKTHSKRAKPCKKKDKIHHCSCTLNSSNLKTNKYKLCDPDSDGIKTRSFYKVNAISKRPVRANKENAHCIEQKSSKKKKFTNINKNIKEAPKKNVLQQVCNKTKKVNSKLRSKTHGKLVQLNDETEETTTAPRRRKTEGKTRFSLKQLKEREKRLEQVKLSARNNIENPLNRLPSYDLDLLMGSGDEDSIVFISPPGKRKLLPRALTPRTNLFKEVMQDKTQITSSSFAQPEVKRDQDTLRALYHLLQSKRKTKKLKSTKSRKQYLPLSKKGRVLPVLPTIEGEENVNSSYDDYFED